MQYKVVYPGWMPTMNDYTDANRESVYAGSRMKKRNQQSLWWFIRAQLPPFVKIKTPIRIHYTYYERNRKRDHDNVAGFVHKVFQDALVELKYLENDGWSDICGFTDEFMYDRDEPRIEFIIEEVTGNDY